MTKIINGAYVTLRLRDTGDLWIAAVVDPEGNGIGLSAHQDRPTPVAQEAT